MSNLRKSIVVLSAICMSFLWRFALAETLAIQFFRESYPLSPAIFSVILAICVTHLVSGRGQRKIWLLLGQITVYVISWLVALNGFLDRDGALPFYGWIRQIAIPQSLQEWYVIVFITVATLLFWSCGVLLVKKPLDHRSLCARFDAGVGAFLALFLISCILFWQHGVRIESPLSGALLLPFFSFSIIGLALAGSSSSARKEFLPGFKGVGAILCFCIVVVTVVSATGSLLLPLLRMGAQSGYSIARAIAEPVGGFVSRVLIAVFGHQVRADVRLPQTQALENAAIVVTQDSGWLDGPLKDILSSVALGLTGLIAVTAVLFLGWLLLRWLMIKTPQPSILTPESERLVGGESEEESHRSFRLSYVAEFVYR